MFLCLYCYLLLLLYFICPDELITLGRESLVIWYRSILPTLFPSMILAGVLLPCLTRYNRSNRLLLKTAALLGISEKGMFAVLPGFLCGFPMGSYCSRKLLENKAVTREEAQRILAFSNNIGPVYFLSVIAVNLSPQLKLSALLIFYCIPLLYALISGWLSKWQHKFRCAQKAAKPAGISAGMPDKISMLILLDDSINSAIQAVLRLCAYIFVARTFLIFPLLAGRYIPFITDESLAICNALLEITSGIDKLKQLPIPEHKLVLLEIPFLVFGGVCSIAQTACMLRGSSLSIGRYIKHKCIQGVLAFSICIPLYFIL